MSGHLSSWAEAIEKLSFQVPPHEQQSWQHMYTTHTRTHTHTPTTPKRRALEENESKFLGSFFGLG